ncbi:unnamed protein product [Macrosiphum euphorbiae]|uniref:Uncharacterized protein n=1 Tax=Macrosiphum euphorbiae TaxID=13131 RepID=A0AAV0XRS6_9HEMI|nr:unnamed protein product [Macrosiphum euphorbiae]
MSQRQHPQDQLSRDEPEPVKPIRSYSNRKKRSSTGYKPLGPMSYKEVRAYFKRKVNSEYLEGAMLIYEAKQKSQS